MKPASLAETKSELAADGSAVTPVSKVFLVDDHPAVREALALVIGRNYPDLTVCGEADSAPAALDKIGQCNPDLAVIDITLMQGNGLELTERLRALHPRIRVLIYSMHDPAIYAARALRAGARGYVSKELGVAEVLAALRQVRDGNRVFPAPLAGGALDGFAGASHAVAVDSADLLSNRELEVLELLGDGCDMSAIAERMQLSVKTVETYRARLKKKLGITHRMELIRFAVERALERRPAANRNGDGDGDGDGDGRA